MAKRWNITCECGYDSDYRTLKDARYEAAGHLKHNADGKVFIDQVETEPGDFEDYQTGRSVVVA